MIAANIFLFICLLNSLMKYCNFLMRYGIFSADFHNCLKDGLIEVKHFAMKYIFLCLIIIY